MHHLYSDNLSNVGADAAFLISDASADILLYLLLLNGRAFVLLFCCLFILRFIKSSAAVRHFVVAVSVAAVALLPLTSRLGPAFDITVETSYLQEIGAGIATGGKASVASDHHEASLFASDLFYLGCLAVYLLGLTTILAKVLLDNLKLLFLIKLCRPVTQQNWLDRLEKHRINLGISRRIELRYSDLNASPSTWGAFRPVILLPNSALQWPDHLIDSTLLHELAHIKRYDWLVQQIARCIYAFYWLNPLCRIAINKIFAHAETACDDLAINSGVPNLDYAECLVDVAEQALYHRNYRFATLAMASRGKRGSLSDRVLTILNRHECRAPLTKAQILICLSAFLCVLLPLSSVRATFVERTIEPPGPVYFEEKLARFSYPPEEYINAIPVHLPPKNAMIEKSGPGKTVEAVEPGRQLADLKSSLSASGVPPGVNTAETADKDAPLPVRNKNALPRQEERLKTPSANSEEFLKMHIKNALNSISQTLAHQKTDTDSAPIEAESVVVSHSPINMVIPEYPYRALTRGIEGQVIVEYSLDALGKVIEAEIVSAEPSAIFNRHVLKAIKSSTFNPRKIDGKPVPAEDLVEKYVFVLES